MSKEVIKKKSKGKHWRGVKVSVVDFTKFTDKKFIKLFMDVDVFTPISIFDFRGDDTSIPHSHFYIHGKLVVNEVRYYTRFTFLKAVGSSPSCWLHIYDTSPEDTDVKPIFEKKLSGELLRCCWGYLFHGTQIMACKIFLDVDVLDISSFKSV